MPGAQRELRRQGPAGRRSCRRRTAPCRTASRPTTSSRTASSCCSAARATSSRDFKGTVADRRVRQQARRRHDQGHGEAGHGQEAGRRSRAASTWHAPAWPAARTDPPGSTKNAPQSEHIPRVVRWHLVRRLALALALSACSSQEAEPQVELPETPGLVSVAPDDHSAAQADTASDPAVAGIPNVFDPMATAAAPVADVPKPRRLSEGRHGTSIAMVEIAADGAGAISIDFAKHVRLWPALDGSREPVVVPISSPAQIVLHHDADGFSIASIDTAGGVEILAIDNAGMLTRHASLGADPPYARVVTTGTGFCRDAPGSSARLDRPQRRPEAEHLLPPPGERIAGMFRRPVARSRCSRRARESTASGSTRATTSSRGAGRRRSSISIPSARSSVPTARDLVGDAGQAQGTSDLRSRDQRDQSHSLRHCRVSGSRSAPRGPAQSVRRRPCAESCSDSRRTIGSCSLTSR